MQINSLLVPIDFTEVSKNAVDHAIVLAKRLNATIIFVHGHTVNYAPSGGTTMATMAHPAPGTVTSQQKLNEQKLEDFLQRFPSLSTVKYSSSVVLGAAVESICKTAADENVDLIVMGTEGANKVEAFFMGSVSEKVSRKAVCPVWVIPDDLKSYEIDTISLALDTKNAKPTASFDTLVQLLKAFKAKLRIIHISTNEENAFKKEELLVYYQNLLGDIEHSFHVFYEDDANKGISQFLEKNPIDLLVLLYREHGFFERLFQPGVRRNLVFKTDVPLLILK